jgi:hypothetical protein
MTEDQNARLVDIIARLTRHLRPDVQAEILAVGFDTTQPTPLRVINNSGIISVNIVLADGRVLHVGEFDAHELDEPLADIPTPDDIPRAPAEAFGITDALDTTTGDVHIVLAIAVQGSWVAYTMPLAEAQRLHDLLGRQLDRQLDRHDGPT